jgi:hypothetical protein
LLANDKLLLCFRIGFLPSSLEPCFYRISLTYHFRTQHLQCHTTKIPTAADVAVTATARSVEAKATARSVEAKATALNVEARAPIAAMTNVVKAASAESDVRKEEDMVAIDEKSMANVVKKAQDMAAVEKGARNTESVAKAAVASAAVSEGTTMTARVAGMEEMERGAMRLVEAEAQRYDDRPSGGGSGYGSHPTSHSSDPSGPHDSCKIPVSPATRDIH